MSESSASKKIVKSAGRIAKKKRFRIPALILFCILIIVAVLAVVITNNVMARAQARDMVAEDWLELYTEDVAAVRLWSEQLEESVSELEEIAARTPDSITEPISPEDQRDALFAWARSVDLINSMRVRSNYHRDYVTWMRGERNVDHLRGFLLCDAADLTVQHYGLRLSEKLGGQKRWETLLNEESESFGIREGTLDLMKTDIVSVDRTARQFAARQYLKIARLDGDFDEATGDEEGEWLLETVERLHPLVRSQILTHGKDLVSTQAEDFTADLAFKAWFPIQKSVADTMGHIKVKRPGVYLITREQLHELCEKIQPGDIAITRKNWHASNAGIPGFWPHAMIVLGTPKEMESFFDDEEVREWCREQSPSAESLPELLKAKYPEKWDVYTRGRSLSSVSESGESEKMWFENRIIESIAEGVSFHPIEESMNADGAAVFRTRLSKKELAIAAERAFSHHGKPYDYNFDFISDSALVCSELVYKCYQPSEGFRGVGFPLDNTLGRPTLAPTTIVQKFDSEEGMLGQELFFVGFLDPHEGEGKSVWETEETLRESWKRPKWSMMIE